MGFRRAKGEVFPGTRHRRRWQHDAANVLNEVPRSAGGPLARAEDEEVRRTAKGRAPCRARPFPPDFPDWSSPISESSRRAPRGRARSSHQKAKASSVRSEIETPSRTTIVSRSTGMWVPTNWITVSSPTSRKCEETRSS